MRPNYWVWSKSENFLYRFFKTFFVCDVWVLRSRLFDAFFMNTLFFSMVLGHPAFMCSMLEPITKLQCQAHPQSKGNNIYIVIIQFFAFFCNSSSLFLKSIELNIYFLLTLPFPCHIINSIYLTNPPLFLIFNTIAQQLKFDIFKSIVNKH